jgi:pimeloyl-ACP methyl ester carboxylesterase
MSAYGTKQTYCATIGMSAFGGKAEMDGSSGGTTMNRFVQVILSLVVSLSLVGCATETWETVPAVPALPPPDESGYAPVNDISMYYEIWNKDGDDPILLLNGLIGGNQHWGYQVPVLMQNHKVIAAESRGNARTTTTQQPISRELMLSDYASLMDYLKIDKASVVGWSSGAVLGIEMAMAHPERIEKLFAFGARYNASGIIPNSDNNPIFSAVITDQIERSRNLSATPDQFDAALNQLLEMAQADLKAEELGRITTPTVIAAGDHEETIPLEHTVQLSKMIPGAKLVLIPNVSHMGLWQDPVAFNNAMTEFFDSR